MSRTYQVVLVDDEPIILRSLKVAIPWAELGLAVVGEARNGSEALRLVQELKPDIVISDIRMPVMDGISMMRAAMSEHPELLFVILSGYGEFDYAREALRYGAFDYLLKPIDHDELERVMREAAAKLERETQSRQESEYLRRSVQSLSSLVRERLIASLLDGGGGQSYDRLYWLQGWELEHPYRLLIVSLDDALVMASWNYADRKLWTFAVGNVLSEYGERHGALTAFPFRQGEWVMVMPLLEQADAVPMAEELISLVKSCTKLSCSVGISLRCAGVDALHEAYRSAQSALVGRFVSGREGVYSAESGSEPHSGAALRNSSHGDGGIGGGNTGNRGSVSENNGGNGSNRGSIGGNSGGIGSNRESDGRIGGGSNAASLAERHRQRRAHLAAWERALADAWLGHDAAGFTRQLDDGLARLRELADSREPADLQLIELAVGLHRRLADHGQELGDTLGALLAALPGCRTLEESGRVFTDTMLPLLGSSASAADREQEGRSIQRALEYVAERFHHDLGIDEVSEYAGLSASHFCVSFKKVTGLTFLEHLTKLRMDRACSILRHSDVKVYQIAPLVGYQDPKYFTQVFKKLTGMTPSEYRSAESQYP